MFLLQMILSPNSFTWFWLPCRLWSEGLQRESYDSEPAENTVTLMFYVWVLTGLLGTSRLVGLDVNTIPALGSLVTLYALGAVVGGVYLSLDQELVNKFDFWRDRTQEFAFPLNVIDLAFDVIQWMTFGAIVWCAIAAIL